MENALCVKPIITLKEEEMGGSYLLTDSPHVKSLGKSRRKKEPLYLRNTKPAADVLVGTIREILQIAKLLRMPAMWIKVLAIFASQIILEWYVDQVPSIVPLPSSPIFSRRPPRSMPSPPWICRQRR